MYKFRITVEYLLVGGYALGIHGYPRYTGDVDIWVKPEQVNAEKVMAVLEAENLILRRAARADLGAFKRILDRVADVPPMPDDEILN